MFYSLKNNVFVRHYEKIALITCPILLMDEVVDEIGSIFLEQLSYEPTSIDSIVKKLNKIFNIDANTLKNDAIFFYEKLSNDGYLNSYDNQRKLTNSCNSHTSEPINTAIKNTSESATHYLNKYFLSNPHLLTFQIELTDMCNERCIHCYIPHSEKNNILERNFVLDMLSQCKSMGVLTVAFSGGEPMLHPNFSEFVKTAKDYDMHATVFSNLTMLDDEKLSALKYKHQSNVNVSLYSMNPNTHDNITCLPGSFDKTINNIIRLIENDITVTINCPVMQPNKNEFENVIKFGNEHGCRVVNDYMIIAQSNGCTENLKYRLTNEDLNDVIYKIIYNNSQFDPSILQYEASNKLFAEERVCGAGISTLSLSATGKAFPCAGWNNHECGDLKREKLKSIWEHSDVINYLRSLRMKDFTKCRDCQNYDFCSLCMARNSNEDPNGNIFNISPITCEAATIYHSILNKFILKKNNKKSI